MSRSTTRLIPLALTLPLGLAVLAATAGPLSPAAGPVAPTPGPEPRIPINATNTPGDANSLFKITQPGSYYLSGNIQGVASKHGIEITASGVTLDLNGFELLGVLGSLGIGGSLDGVRVNVVAQNIHIHNGSVRNWAGDGVDAAAAANSALHRLQASGNKLDGLRLGAGGVVEGCAARTNGGDGIVADAGAAVRGNVSSFNGGDGIIAVLGATISGNTVRSNGGDGVVAVLGATISGNTVRSNGDDGIVANASTVSDNTVTENGGDGIQVSDYSLVLNNLCAGNGSSGDGAGIHVTLGDNRIESNHLVRNVTGLVIDSSGNIAVRNTATENTTNYAMVWGNISYSGDNPWANFSF